MEPKLSTTFARLEADAVQPGPVSRPVTGERERPSVQLSNLRVLPVDWNHPHAVALRDAMAAEIRHRYADRLDDPQRPSPHPPVDPATVAFTALAYMGETPVGHVALRRHRGDIELKRMYVVPATRGNGVGVALLAAATDAGQVLGAVRLVLRTWDRQPEAVRLYERFGYQPIPVFPPYDLIPGSLCFAKPIEAPAG